MKKITSPSGTFSARVKSVQLLLNSIHSNKDEKSEFDSISEQLNSSTWIYESKVVSDSYDAYAALLEMSGLLYSWRRSVLAAAPDSSRFFTAAKEKYKLFTEKFSLSESDEPLLKAAATILDITSIADVEPFFKLLASKPLPIGINEKEPLKSIYFKSNIEEKEKPEPLTVAFLEFSVDDNPADKTHFLTPGEVHDLDIEVRISRWPENAESLRVSCVSLESSSTYDFPTFIIDKPSGSAPYREQRKGRAILKASHSIQAKPFEFKYTAEFTPTISEQPVSVTGHRTLKIESIDLTKSPITGYFNLDGKIIKIRDVLRNTPLMSANDLISALQMLTPICKLAANALNDAIFKDANTEADFQKIVRSCLRQNPFIGQNLEEHGGAAGGFKDLSFNGIPLELKFIKDKKITLSDCSKFIEQTISYAVGQNKRLGLLCILDMSKKRNAPVPAEDYLDILESPSHSGIKIITLIIQGNLALPSDLSKK